MDKKATTESQPKCSGIQIWYESYNPKVYVCLDMDINLWRLDNQSNLAYLDIGLMIHDTFTVKKVNIYFPFKFGINKITNLGEKLGDLTTLQGVFNEDYSIKSSNKEIVVTDDNKREVFRIYSLDKTQDLNVEEQYNGTLVSFKPSGNRKNYANQPTTERHHKTYYRFRIEADNFFPFIERYQPKNSFFESAFIETEVIDVRINEKRNQNTSLIEAIQENKRFVLTNVHFIVITSLNDDIVSDGINLIYKRQLEADGFWRKYLEDYSYGRMSVYKANSIKYVENKNINIKDANNKTVKRYIEDFSCFAKVNYRKCNKKTISRYTLALLVSTIALTFISTSLYDMIKMLVEWLVDWLMHLF